MACHGVLDTGSEGDSNAKLTLDVGGTTSVRWQFLLRASPTQEGFPTTLELRADGASYGSADPLLRVVADIDSFSWREVQLADDAVEAPFGLTETTRFYLAVQIDSDDAVHAKWWQYGDAEPGAWTLESTLAGQSLDQVGLYYRIGGSGPEIVEAHELRVWVDDVEQGDPFDDFQREAGAGWGTSTHGEVWASDPSGEGGAVEIVCNVAWDSYAAADPNGELLATIQNDDAPVEGATARAVRIALNETGSGTFKINRYSSVAGAAVLARGNVIKCRWPWRDDYDFAFLLEKGDFTLASADEHGGEEFTFGGRGILAYLARAIMDAVAYTTGLDVVDTFAELWHTNKAPRPVGAAFDPADPDYVYVIGSSSRRVYKIRQSDRVVVATSPALWAGSTNYAAGLSFDPADATIVWALEAPWAQGGGGNTKLRKIQRSDWSVLDTFDLGAAQLTDIRASSADLWTSRYNTGKIERRAKADGSVVDDYTVTYNGSAQTHPNGIAVSENGTGTEIAMWFGGTSAGGVKRALIADLTDPSTVTRTINTAGIAAFGGDWSLEGGSEFFYMVSVTLGLTWKYQLTSATPHDPIDGIWRLDEGLPGAILWRVILEAQAGARPQAPLPDLTFGFSSTLDSNGDPWDPHDGTLEFDAKITESVLAVALRLLPYGLVETMSPYLVLGAFNASTYGVNRTGAFAPGVVRFEKGVNIIPELGRQERERELHSHMLAVGKGGLYARAVLADLGYVREGGTTTDLEDATALEGTAEAMLDDERVKSERIRFAVPIGDDEANGRYLPFTHYNPGDLVTLHTGAGEHDFNEETFVLYAMTLAESEAGAFEEAILELGSATIADAAPATSTGGGGTGSGSGTGGSGGGGAVITSTAVTVEGLDDAGATVTTAVGSRIRVIGAQVYQQAAGIIQMIVTAATNLLGLDDVDADGITDGQTLAWDAATSTFIPSSPTPATTSEEFTAAGALPETFTLAAVPAGIRRVYRNGARLPSAAIGGVDDAVEIDTVTGDDVVIDYEV